MFERSWRLKPLNSDSLRPRVDSKPRGLETGGVDTSDLLYIPWLPVMNEPIEQPEWPDDVIK